MGNSTFDLNRVRIGELVAAIGGVLLLIDLFLNWFQRAATPALAAYDRTGWHSAGWFAVALLVLAAMLALGLAVVTGISRTPAVPVALGVLTTVAGIAATITVLARLVFTPDLGPQGGDVSAQLGAYLGLLFVLLLTAGSWMSMGDESPVFVEAPR